jgi:hypothetical protein
MRIERFNSPTAETLPEIERSLLEGRHTVAQFVEPPYPPVVLAELNRLSAHYGERLEVRFYGHYGSAFDCTVLTQLPDVESLSVDCLSRVEHIEQIADLKRLRSLSLGVFDLADGSILNAPNLRRLVSLTLAETRRRVFDLSALASFSALEHLRVSGHTRNLDVVGELNSISDLTLRAIPKRASVSFVSRMRGLRELYVYLGGRTSIGEITVPDLEVLEVVWVRGLQDLGDIARFPALKSLLVEDQLQLEHIRFGAGNAELKSVRVFNCKSLRALAGLEALPALEELRVFRTAIEPMSLRRERFSTTLRTVAFSTGKSRLDRAVREAGADLGYGPSGSAEHEIAIDWQRGY